MSTTRMTKTSVVESTISETIESTADYIATLSELLKQLETVESQIKVTAAKSKGVIDHHFPYVVGALTSLLDQRQTALQKQVLTTRDEALRPLEDCRIIIQNKLKNAEFVISQGEMILKEQNVPNEEIGNFCDKASLLGSLPEIPNPSNVANITVHFDDKFLSGILSSLKMYGSIRAFCPVQICMAEPYPGALQLTWIQHDEPEEEEDDELPSDQDANDENIDLNNKPISFRLQFCAGNVYKSKQKQQTSTNLVFQEVYSGPETNFTCRGLEAGQIYSFRVASSCHGNRQKAQEWSDWSQPYLATTNLPHYEWCSSDINYVCTNNGRIASRITEGTAGILISKYSLNKQMRHSLQFRILEVGITANIDEGIALMDTGHTTSTSEGFGTKQAIYINIQGLICVGNKEMTSRLPPLKRGSVVTIDLQPLSGSHNKNKLRVTLESQEQQIISDWNVADDGELRFACFFRCKGWKIEIN